MNKIKSVYSKLYTPWTIQAGRIFFYLGLLFEVIIFLLDRASWINPYQSMMFRATFVLFVLKCICTKYDKKQFVFVCAAAVFSILTYKLCGKDEAVRYMVFIIALKDLDLKRTLRFDYFLSAFGVAVLGILSILGIMGEVLSGPGYAEKADAFMVSFGLGSSNTWAIQIWVLLALAVYLYYDRFPKWIYGIIAVFGVVVYLLSRTSTALVMIEFTAIAGFILSSNKKLQQGKLTYYIAGLIVLICTGFSVYAAKISTWWEYQPKWQQRLDHILTGRITSIYAFENGGGVLSNWKLFGSNDYTEYFDMGLVRMFWWYGIIPGVVIILAILLLLIYQYRKNDYMGMLLVVSMTIFSVFEAHFVSPFIARAYILFMFGEAWYRVVHDKENTREMKHVAFYIGSLAKGGAERVFCNLAEYFISRGCRVTIISQYIRDNEYELPKGCERIISDITPEEEKGRIYNFFARYIKFHNILVRTDADVLLTTIGKNNFMAIAASVFIKTKVIASIVADPKEEYVSHIMRLLLQILFPEADGIIMQTTQSVKFLKLGLDKKCIILPNSVSPNFVLPRYEGDRTREIYTVGRMDENKNHKMAIKAFAGVADKYPEAKLVLVGDGELRHDLETLVDSLKLTERVVFTGIVSDVPKRLEKAYIFLLTSYTEGMPNTLLEAMALGTACISTDCPCGGPYDLITPGKDGILVPVNDVNELTKQLDRLLSDAEYTDSLGRNAHEMMKAYTPEVVNAKWEAYFREVVKA